MTVEKAVSRQNTKDDQYTIALKCLSVGFKFLVNYGY